MPDWKLSWIYREGRRTIWLNIVTLDTFMSVCYGRPPAIAEQHCNVVSPQNQRKSKGYKVSDVYKGMPSLHYGRQENVTESSAEQSLRNPTLAEIFAAPSNRGQFHLLKLHLCHIIRRLLDAVYLSPEPVPQRKMWDQMQLTMEDLHELGASIPAHLQVAHVDKQPNTTYQQQAICLDMLINYAVILANKPLIMSNQDRHNVRDAVAESISATRQRACDRSLTNAAYGICSLLTNGRNSILNPSIHLILSAWGIYPTTAELIARHAMTTKPGSPQAHEAYKNLTCLLQHFACLQKLCPSAAQEHTILKDLISSVSDKIKTEFRLPSPDEATTNQAYSRAKGEQTFTPRKGRQQQLDTNKSSRTSPPVVLPACVDAPRDTSATQEGLAWEGVELHWFNEFLAQGDSRQEDSFIGEENFLSNTFLDQDIGTIFGADEAFMDQLDESVQS